eukprot:GHVP01049111.1.p1 GENE.GHVP01049111.1~~GHVP01049111.1.p1  ORF type:complete len:252 (+),score=44.58 GHVP01049111.1:662-1417(+)
MIKYKKMKPEDLPKDVSKFESHIKKVIDGSRKLVREASSLIYFVKISDFFGDKKWISTIYRIDELLEGKNVIFFLSEYSGTISNEDLKNFLSEVRNFCDKHFSRNLQSLTQDKIFQKSFLSSNFLVPFSSMENSRIQNLLHLCEIFDSLELPVLFKSFLKILWEYTPFSRSKIQGVWPNLTIEVLNSEETRIDVPFSVISIANFLSVTEDVKSVPYLPGEQQCLKILYSFLFRSNSRSGCIDFYPCVRFKG